MPKSEIIMIDDTPALRLTQEMLDALSVEIGEHVEVTVADCKLQIVAVKEIERATKMNRIFAELLVKREGAYRRLAEGVK